MLYDDAVMVTALILWKIIRWKDRARLMFNPAQTWVKDSSFAKLSDPYRNAIRSCKAAILSDYTSSMSRHYFSLTFHFYIPY